MFKLTKPPPQGLKKTSKSKACEYYFRRIITPS